jgi:hypothetical protein
MRYILNKKHKLNVHHDTITDTLINIAENNDILICYKNRKIDTKNYSTLEKMNLRKVPFAFHKNIVKYIQEKDRIERYILARNMENNVVELFFIDRDFNEKQAGLFLKSCDDKQVEKVLKNKAVQNKTENNQTSKFKPK